MDNKKPLVQIALFGMLGAILVVVQVVLSFLPNIELVTALIIVYTLVYGKQAIYPVCVFIVMMGIIWGFSYFWIFYLYVWPALVLVVLLVKKFSCLSLWVGVAALYGLFFGAMYAVMFVFTGGWQLVFATWVAGIKFDILHCIGNTASAFLILPLEKALNSLNMRMKKE